MKGNNRKLWRTKMLVIQQREEVKSKDEIKREQNKRKGFIALSHQHKYFFYFCFFFWLLNP